jgi:TonB family protein
VRRRAAEVTSVICQGVTVFLILNTGFGKSAANRVFVPQSKTLRFMRHSYLTCAALCLITIVFLSAASVTAQDTPSPRRLIYQVPPKYPPELKRNEIGGVVRLSISINPNGSVAKVSTIGGDAALVAAATVAVKQWKYVPANYTTAAEVQLNFVPH